MSIKNAPTPSDHEIEERSIARIGIFDSGVGGLSLLKKLFTHFPAEYIYYGDTQFAPYGNKSPQEIIDRSLAISSILTEHDIDALVIACHTASAHAAARIAKIYGSIPIINSTDLVIQPALESCAQKIGILATPATISTHAHKEQLLSHNPAYEIIEQACPDLAAAIECNDAQKINALLAEYLKPLQEALIDTLLLGCTHYCLIKDTIQALLPKVNILSAQDHIINSVEDFQPVHQFPTLKILTSGPKLPPFFEASLLK